MAYKVKIDHVYFNAFEGVFDSVFINDNAEVMLLYNIVIGEDSKKKVERMIIPLSEIKSILIYPNYEDNR